MGKYIKNLYNRDKECFKAFQKCGNLNAEHFKQLDFTATRIKNYEREGYIKKCSYDQRGKENGIAYKLTDKGKKVGYEKFGLKNYAQNLSVRHNMDVADKYLSLSREERETVLNEREVRDLVIDRIRQIEDEGERNRYREMLEQGTMSMPDIVYTTEQETLICYETITNNYGQEEIQAKQVTSTFLKAELVLNKI